MYDIDILPCRICIEDLRSTACFKTAHLQGLRASAHKRHINDIFVAGSSSSWALTAKYRRVAVCGVAGWGTTTFCRSCSPSCSIVATCSTIAVGGFGSVALLLLLQIALLYKSVNLSFACETNFICEIV